MDRLEGRFAARQIPGRREYQEDDYGLIERSNSDSDEVLVIADGMGGQVSGDKASRTVIKTFIETYSDTTGLISDRLRACLKAANNALASAIDAHPALTGMGTTVVAAVISQRGLEWISVGDSPLWLFREGQLRRLNTDHSMVAVFADLVAVGRMTEQEAATDPKRHALRSAVMGNNIPLIDVSSQPVALKRGDHLLLASDGLLTLADDEIACILQTMQAAPLSEVAEALIRAVEDAAHPHQDNTTVLLYTPDADKGMDAVIADPRDGKSRPGHQLPKRIRQLKIGLVEIALGVVFLALLYWFWPTPNTPPTLTDALPSKDAPVLPEAPAQLDTGKVSGELAKKAEDEADGSGSDGSSADGSDSGESKSDGAKTGESDSDESKADGDESGESGSGGSKSDGDESGGSGSDGSSSGGSESGESGSSGTSSDESDPGASNSGGSGPDGSGSRGSKPGGKAGETKSGETKSEKPPTRRKRGNI